MKGQQPTTETQRSQLIEPRMLDLFGQVQITRADVYAWLLAIPRLDPENPRAMQYIKVYDVVGKVTRAKLEGSFDTTTEEARDTPRYRELLNECPWPATSINVFGVGQVAELKPLKNYNPKRLKALNRPKEVIRREKALARKEKTIRQNADASMLCRLPSSTPSLSNILKEIGNPRIDRLAKAMGVSDRTARRWVNDDEAPRAVMLALYWITHWGAKTIDAHAHNDAVNSARIASIRLDEVAGLRKQIVQIERLADFGSANDPLPQVAARMTHHVPAASPLPMMANPETSPALAALVA